MLRMDGLAGKVDGADGIPYVLTGTTNVFPNEADGYKIS
jgi:hypothetical protein